MSLVNRFTDTFRDITDTISWRVKNTTLPVWVFTPISKILRRERGTTMPYYFSGEFDLIKNTTDKFYRWLNNFLHYHESERNVHGMHEKSMFNRMLYVLSNFHIYSNDTMCNLYYSTRMPIRDYNRMKNYYNIAFVSFLAYNTLSSVVLIALNNHAFRARKATIPTVILASIPTYICISLNYHLSDSVKNYFVNNTARRLGYGYLIQNNSKILQRNVDFIGK